MTAIFATSLGSILAANTMVMTALFTTTFTKVALMTGYFLLGVGAAAVFFVPSARVWGKRHAFIIGLIFLIFSSAWGAAARDKETGKGYYDSFVAARAIQGVGCAPYETLVNAAVSDLYFVHQRGLRMAFTNLAVFGGAFFTPIVVGKITNSIGWWWTFNLVAIFCAICLPAVVLFCPEMAYRRDAALNTDLTAGSQSVGEVDDAAPREFSSSTEVQASEGAEKLPNAPADQHQPQPTEAGTSTPPHTAESGTASPVIPPKKTFLQSLALFDGRKTDDSYWRLLLRPFALVLHPAFLWACLVQGTVIGWTVFIGAILASIFTAPPYYWNEIRNGYAYTGPFVGALIGFVLAGALADPSVKFLTRRNNGVYEPEFRILMMVPMTIIGCAGLYGFGITASQVISGKYHWSVPIAFFGLEVVGMVIGTVSSSLYIVDAYRTFPPPFYCIISCPWTVLANKCVGIGDLAIEGFTMMIIFKNFFSFVLTFYAFDWITRGLGIRTTITVIASIQVAVCLTSIPMCKWSMTHFPSVPPFPEHELTP